MCTYFTLHYRCKHTQTQHRCPRNAAAFLDSSLNDPESRLKLACGIQYSMYGYLADDCMDCKIAHGIAPGSQKSGLAAWAELDGTLRGLSRGDSEMSNAGMESVQEAGGMDPRLLTSPVRFQEANKMHNQDASVGREQPQGIPAVEQKVQSWLSSPHTGICDSGNEQACGDVRPPAAIIPESSSRMRDILEQLSAYNRDQASISPRADSPQDASESEKCPAQGGNALSGDVKPLQNSPQCSADVMATSVPICAFEQDEDQKMPTF